MPAIIVGVGSFVPETVLTNDDLVEMRPQDIKPEDWIAPGWTEQRTGVEERRVTDKMASSDLMQLAANRALLDAGLTISDMDIIVSSTSFSDKGSDVPRTSEIIKAKLEAPQQVLSVQENAECAGFCWALVRAQMEMNENGFKRALVVSGDRTTAFTNYRDRRTCPLFGDAGGAVILQQDYGNAGILASIRGTDTTFINCIEIPAGGSAMPFEKAADEEVLVDSNFGILNPELFKMKMPGGTEMLKYIGGKIGPDACLEVCQKAGVDISRVKYIIPHQANIRISDAIEKKLALKPGVVFKENQRIYGNTSGSSIPLALDTLYRQGNLKEMDLIILLGFGAGFTYAANLIWWTKEYKG